MAMCEEYNEANVLFMCIMESPLLSYIILDEAAVPDLVSGFFFDKNVRESSVRSVGSDTSSGSRRSSSGLQVRNETRINLGTPFVRLHASNNISETISLKSL